MWARLKNAFELVLWVAFGRDTSKMRAEYEEFVASLPPHRKPGKTVT